MNEDSSNSTQWKKHRRSSEVNLYTHNPKGNSSSSSNVHKSYRGQRKSRSSSSDLDSFVESNYRLKSKYRVTSSSRSGSVERARIRKARYSEKHGNRSKDCSNRKSYNERDHLNTRHRSRHIEDEAYERRKWRSNVNGMHHSPESKCLEADKSTQKHRKTTELYDRLEQDDVSKNKYSSLKSLLDTKDVDRSMLNNEFNQMNYARAYGIDISSFALIQPDILKVELPTETKQLSTHERRRLYKEETIKHPDRFWKCNKCEYMNYLSNYQCTRCKQLRNANR